MSTNLVTTMSEARNSSAIAPAANTLCDLLDLLPLPALVVDTKSGGIIHENPAASASGLGTAAPVEAFATEGEGRISVGEIIQYLIVRGGGTEGLELTWHTPRQRFYRVFSRTLPTQTGGPVFALLLFLDLSPQKAAEAELQQALESRDEFFSVATHELKDPLFALRLSIQLLRRLEQQHGQVPAHVQRHLEVSQRQIDRLGHLIENLLDVSRIMNGRVHLDIEAVDVCALAGETVGRTRERAAAAKTPLAVETGAPLIGYYDRFKLEQILSNLLTNAIKYGKGQPVVVRVLHSGDDAILEVEDHGIGIAPEDQQRIFNRFERASPGHRKESLGLGLYIVRSLVEAHGGVVTVSSELGKGSTFRVTLPRLRLRRAEEGNGKQYLAGG